MEINNSKLIENHVSEIPPIEYNTESETSTKSIPEVGEKNVKHTKSPSNDLCNEQNQNCTAQIVRSDTSILEQLDLLPNTSVVAKHSEDKCTDINKSEIIESVTLQPSNESDLLSETDHKGQKRKICTLIDVSDGNLDIQTATAIKCRKSNRVHKQIDYAAFDNGTDQESNKFVSVSTENNVSSSNLIATNGSPQLVKKRKRGRPKKEVTIANNIDATDCNNRSSEQIESYLDSKLENGKNSGNEEGNCDSTVVIPDCTQGKSVTNNDSPTPIVQTRKRGRPRKKPTLPIISSLEIEADTIDEHVDDKSKCSSEKNAVANISLVTCAVCNQEIQSSKWSGHNERVHNNLAWKIGEDAIDLNDRDVVICILNKLYKKKKYFNCEKCKEKKKSALGFLSHMLMCNKSQDEIDQIRVKCELCDRTMLPVSMTMHMKLSHSQSKVDKENIIDVASNEQETQTIKSKRTAAVKASSLIQTIAKNGEIIETSAEVVDSQVFKHFIYTNFDFHATYYLQRLFEKILKTDEVAKCLFKDCDFTSSQLNEIVAHVGSCELKPKEGFTCKFCILTYETKDEIQEHIKTVHSKKSELNKNFDESDYESDAEDTYEDDSNKQKRRSNKKNDAIGDFKKYPVRFLEKISKKVIPVKESIPYNWMLKFCNNNYMEENLFQNLDVKLTDWPELVDDVNLIDYMPMLESSVDTARVTVKGYADLPHSDYSWKKYDIFESELLEDGSSITFLGGPVQAMAWVPTPHTKKNTEQIIAVSVLLDPDKKYYYHTLYDSPGLIQFWNFGILQNDLLTQLPEFLFSIAHNYGMVWSMEWCPSGCHDFEETELDGKLKRLGLLAVCCADSFVYIYSVPQSKQLQSGIYKPTPVLKLQLEAHYNNNLKKIVYHATKISWSKASGHQYVAVGYSNGMIAMYNLRTTSKLLRMGKDVNHIETLLPYKTLQAHFHSITALSLFHLNNGCRWLMTGSADRHNKFWDLENTHSPLTSFRKHVITDGVWLNNWICAMFAYDDASSAYTNLSTSMHQVRDYLSEITFILQSLSVVKSVTGSDWANGIIQGTAAGEVMGAFPLQMLYKLDTDKWLKTKRRLLGYINMIERQKNENNASNEDFADKKLKYNETVEKYGIVFCDVDLTSHSCFKDKMYDDMGGKVNKLRTCKPDLYPLQSVNSVSFNPNKCSYLHFASGLQAGFLKVGCLKFLNTKK